MTRLQVLLPAAIGQVVIVLLVTLLGLLHWETMLLVLAGQAGMFVSVACIDPCRGTAKTPVEGP